MAFAAVVLAGVIAAGVTFVLLSHRGGSAEPAARPAARAAGLTAYTTDHGHFTVGVPTSWRRAPAAGSADLLARNQSGSGSLLVRTLTLAKPIDPRHPRAVKDVLGTILHTGGLRVLAERAVTVNGTPGYVYVYTFSDASSGATTMHWHYFFFDGRRLHVLVLQALPASSFDQLAPTFDAIAKSVQVRA
ncbi:MAG TPA: hypothetical protein VFT62_11415 [Mycobacteriales bacterium]|nr:hypothetical protein [Mycobacteriales bacterium]